MKPAGRFSLLLTGIPGTGKTRIGDELSARHGFKHFDVEAGQLDTLLGASSWPALLAGL
jgi:shikimate kinase